MLQVGVGDGEVGCEHGGGDFAAVGAVADKSVDEAWTRGWLGVVVRAGQIDGTSLMSSNERTPGLDLRMPVARRRRSMWSSLHLLSTSHHGPYPIEGYMAWIYQQWQP